MPGCASSIKDYQAKSPDEEAIKGALLRWENSWNNGDGAGVLSVISDDGQIMYGREKTVASKKEYAGILQERMKAYPTTTLGMPEIKVTGEKAIATASLYVRGQSMPVKFDFVRKGGQWLVTRLSY
jgi:ketosteroid isomerase-like protein